MTHRFKIAGAALIASLALGSAAEAHYARGGGGTHIGGGAPASVPHTIATVHANPGSLNPGFHPNVGTKHNYGGNTGVVSTRHPNFNPSIIQKYPGGIAKYHDNDHDGDHHEHNERHHRHRGFYIYTPQYYDNYYDDYSYDNGYTCGYYWQRYLRTGNPKWKYRYYDCIG